MKLHIIFIIIIFLFGCSSNIITDMDTKPDEAIVIGKLNIVYDNHILTGNYGFSFNGNFSGQVVYMPNNDLYFIAKVPIYKNYVSQIWHDNSNFIFDEQYAIFNCNHEKVLYNLGTLNITWSSGPVIRLNMGGLAFALADAVESDGGALITTSPCPECPEFINKFYKTNLPSKDIILKIDTAFTLFKFDSLDNVIKKNKRRQIRRRAGE
jgi:hypothetical protein